MTLAVLKTSPDLSWEKPKRRYVELLKVTVRRSQLKLFCILQIKDMKRLM